MSDLFLRIIIHLLPNAKAWNLTINKTLRKFFEGLTDTGVNIKEFFDLVFLDVFPETTRELTTWEQQFALTNSGLTETQRRDRLAATWRAVGGQSPSYIQQTLRDAGFDVYVHEWWEPGTEPAIGSHTCATPRNPLLYMRREYTTSILAVDCGEPLAACGEEFAICGNFVEPPGYPLVNKIYETTVELLALCGEAEMQCGETIAACNYYETFKENLRSYTVPNDITKWPYFLYIGGETFGDLAQVPESRKSEFEALCLKISPSQQWLGIIVEFI
jgi:uncharacterized protein YmfQ (DUF2313 family)